MSRPKLKLNHDFSLPSGKSLNPFVLAGSHLDAESGVWRLINEPHEYRIYTNAQLDDYHKLPRQKFPARPPLTLAVRARFSHTVDELRGTAGFGFWNDPFVMTGLRTPALPRAIWFFFASPPSNMKLDLNTPGYGWKAATLDAIRLPFFLLAPTAPIAIPLMNIDSVYRKLWPIGQRAIGVSEKEVSADMTAWHDYQIDWGTERAAFKVDGEVILDCNTPPRGPLGFVMWIDNQGMVITPQGQFRSFTLPLHEQQWMEVSKLEISPY